MIKVFLHDWTGARLGEFTNYESVSLETGLSQNPTAGITLPLVRDSLADYLSYTFDHQNDSIQFLLSIYRFNVLTNEYVCIYAGPILDIEEAADENSIPSIAVTSVGPYWRLAKRIANDSTGTGRTEAGLSFTTTDRGQVAAKIIRDSISIDGNHWIRANAVDQGDTSDIAITNWGPWKTIPECIDELSGTLDGFDWTLDFSNAFTTDGYGLVLANFKSGFLYGSDTGVQFDLGGPRNNLASVKRRSSIANLINRSNHVIANTTGDPYNVSYQDTVSISAIGLFEELAESDIRLNALRQALVGLQVAIKKNPQRMIEITPNQSDFNLQQVPIPFIDYQLGDRIYVSATYADRKRIDGLVRLWDIKINWDGTTGAENATLGLYMN